METKACNLTENEVVNLLISTGQQLGWPNANFNDLVERLNYLHKRLKAFNEQEKQPEVKIENQAAAQAWPS